MAEYIQLELHPNYEIMTTYPHNIRKIFNKNDAYEWISNCGYLLVLLDKIYTKHRIIAEQFIPNDDTENKTEVNHINHIKTDNHINNLEWCSHSDNILDRTGHLGVKYEFVDNLPEDAINILQYETRTEIHEFDEERYWYSPSTDLFYFNNKRNYRILYISYVPGRRKSVSMVDINKKSVSVTYNVFRKQYKYYFSQ